MVFPNLASRQPMDVLAYRLGERGDPYLLVVNASNREKIVAWIQEHLGDIYFSLRRFRDASRAWDRSLTLQPANAAVKEKLRRTPSTSTRNGVARSSAKTV